MSRHPGIRRKGSLFAGAALAFVGAAGHARTALAEGVDDGATACIDAYENAQVHRVEGALLRAREGFTTCSNEACPTFIHADCTRFLDEVNVEIPSASFEVTRGGRQISDVLVIEGELVLGRLPTETAIELDPGSHTLRFEVPGEEPVTRSVVVERGDKNRLVSIELPAVVAPPPAPAPAPARLPFPPPAEPGHSPAPWVVLGAGAAGVAAFAILGASGLSEEKRLERTCSPDCSDRALRAVRTKYLIADVSLAVGVSGLLVGGYLLLTREPDPAARVGALPVVVQASPQGGAAMLRGSF